MKTRRLTVAIVLGVALIAFFAGMKIYQSRSDESSTEKVEQRLVRPHSPVLGPASAPVTIVEFFDPACEACRAFYPYVKQLMRRYPEDVRLVLRYAPFHKDSDRVIKLLEAARQQDKYVPVLEMVLAAQPQWADHAKPDTELAFKAAERAGLDLQKALADAQSPQVEAALQQDVKDLKALDVDKTPTFFVNGRSLSAVGPDQLAALVAEEVSKAKK